jgi:predicted metal-dependent hydrolase
MLQVRTPAFDFSEMTPHWAPNREVVASVNANGIIPAYIEPFLVKVMRRAMAELDPVQDAELLRDIDLFNKQEGQHFKLHKAFNTMVREGGYPDMGDYEKPYEDDYTRMLNTRSLRWLLAYCEGFESIGSSVAERWVDGEMDEALGATGEPSLAMELWRWHLAEEFEHRTVAFRVYHRLYGKNRVTAYLYRIYGVVTCAKHMGARTKALKAYLLEVDRKDMTAEERAASEARGAAVDKATAKNSLKSLLHVLSPFYDPEHTRAPKRQDEVLARYSTPAAA